MNSKCNVPKGFVVKEETTPEPQRAAGGCDETRKGLGFLWAGTLLHELSSGYKGWCECGCDELT